MQLYPLSRYRLKVAVSIGLLALIVRLLFIAVYPVNTVMAGRDSAAYKSFAEEISQGRGFHSDIERWVADRPPAYPYFLAAIFRVFGESDTVVFVVQSVIGAIGASVFCLCVMRLAGISAGIFGGLLWSFFPHFLLFTVQVLTESVYIALLVFVLGALLLIEQKRLLGWQTLIVGILLGLIALIKREGIVPCGILVLIVLYYRLSPNYFQIVAKLALMGIIAFLVTVPWLVHNYVELGKPVFSSSGGYNFLVGNNPDANGAYTPPPPEWQAQLADLSELERDQVAWELSTSWIKANPQQFLLLLPQKLVRLFAPSGNFVIDLFDLALIPFYLIGLASVIGKRRNGMVVLAITLGLLASVIVTGLIFVGGWRYRIAIYPGLLLLASFSLAGPWFERRFAGRGEVRDHHVPVLPTK